MSDMTTNIKFNGCHGPEDGIGKKITNTEGLIQNAEERRENRSSLQFLTDVLGGPSLPRQENLDSAKRYLKSAKEFLAQGDLGPAKHWERLAYEALQEELGNYSDYQRESLDHGEQVAQVVKGTGDTLFALGVTGALASLGLPTASNLASQGFGKALLGFGVLVSGGGAGYALSSAAKKAVHSFFGGEELLISDAGMKRDFREGMNLSSFNFFAPFAGALGQTWSGAYQGLSKELIQLLPFSFLQGGHGAAHAIAEGGNAGETVFAAGLSFMLPFAFHGMEKILSAPGAIQNFLNRPKEIQLYDGICAAEGTSVKEALQVAQEKFGLSADEVKNPQIIKSKYRKQIRRVHSDLENGGKEDLTVLNALRNILLRDVCGVSIPEAQGQLADAYLKGKIQEIKIKEAPPSKQNKIEVVDLSRDQHLVPKASDHDVAPTPAWKLTSKISQEQMERAQEIIARKPNPQSTPSSNNFFINSGSVFSFGTEKFMKGQTPFFSANSLNRPFFPSEDGLPDQWSDPISNRELRKLIRRAEKGEENAIIKLGILAEDRNEEALRALQSIKFDVLLKGTEFSLGCDVAVIDLAKQGHKRALEALPKIRESLLDSFGGLSAADVSQRKALIGQINKLLRQKPRTGSEIFQIHHEEASNGISFDQYYDVFSTDPHKPYGGFLRPLEKDQPLPSIGQVWDVKSIEGDQIALTNGQRIVKEEMLKTIDGDISFRIIKGKSGRIQLKPGEKVSFLPAIRGGSGGSDGKSNFMGNNQASNRRVQVIVDLIKKGLEEKNLKFTFDEKEIREKIHHGEMSFYKENSFDQKNGDAPKESFREIAEKIIQDLMDSHEAQRQRDQTTKGIANVLETHLNIQVALTQECDAMIEEILNDKRSPLPKNSPLLIPIKARFQSRFLRELEQLNPSATSLEELRAQGFFAGKKSEILEFMREVNKDPIVLIYHASFPFSFALEKEYLAKSKIEGW